MKNSAIAALAAVVLASSAFAYTPKASEQPSAPAVKLVPTKIVKPTNLPLSSTREVLTVEFSLDTQGQPQDIKVVSNTDRAVKERVIAAFAQWKFDPAAVKAGAEAKRFVLPLDLIPEV